MTPLAPTLTAHLFEPLNAELLVLLRGLEPEDWQRPTSAREWRVRDVVAHLLDGSLHRLAPADARAGIAVAGDERLALPFIGARAVMV
jgi:hypothetical protein